MNIKPLRILEQVYTAKFVFDFENLIQSICLSFGPVQSCGIILCRDP